MRLSFATLALAAGTLVFVAVSATQQSNASRASTASPAALAVADAAFERTMNKIRYNGAYRKLDYPNGDVPASEGVCTDVVIRTYRALGIDLQQLVHEDMTAQFSAYPDRWGLTRPDSNIDHRRVPNLETFFERAADGQTTGQGNDNVIALSLTPSDNAADYLPGDLVSWRLANGLPHIGVVADIRAGEPTNDRQAIVHNIGRGPELADVLFSWKIIGHYRYLPRQTEAAP